MMCIFGYKFRYFWPPRGVKRANFQKSLKKLFKGYINIICANFQVSNPYLLRKLDQNLFSAPKSEFLAPKGGQKCEFQKIEKSTFRLLYEQHLYQISAFYPLLHSGPRGGNFKKSQCFESGSKLVFYKIDTFGHSVLFTRAKNLLRSRFGEPRKIANMVKNQIHYLDPIKT